MSSVEAILLLASASRSGAPSGAVLFALPVPWASTSMRWGTFKYPFKVCRQILPVCSFGCSISYGSGRFVSVKPFKGFATQFFLFLFWISIIVVGVFKISTCACESGMAQRTHTLIPTYFFSHPHQSHFTSLTFILLAGGFFFVENTTLLYRAVFCSNFVVE